MTCGPSAAYTPKTRFDGHHPAGPAYAARQDLARVRATFIARPAGHENPGDVAMNRQWVCDPSGGQRHPKVTERTSQAVGPLHLRQQFILLLQYRVQHTLHCGQALRHVELLRLSLGDGQGVHGVMRLHAFDVH